MITNKQRALKYLSQLARAIEQFKNYRVIADYAAFAITSANPEITMKECYAVLEKVFSRSDNPELLK